MEMDLDLDLGLTIWDEIEMYFGHSLGVPSKVYLHNGQKGGWISLIN